MLRRALKFGTVGALVGGSYFSLRYNDLNHLALCRVGRSIKTVGGIVVDYKVSFWGIQEESEGYPDIRHGFHLRSAQRLLKLCCDNGGCFIKVGQHVAALEFLLPEEYIDTLKVLHANAPQSSLESVKKVINEELGTKCNEVFVDFDEEPIGCASLAQVHKAKLSSGETVAVKVQHDKVYRNSFTDMAVMEALGRLIDKLFPEFSLLWLVEETKKNLPNELDFVNEARNCEKVQKILSSLPWVQVPEINWDLTTKRLLVMEYVEGGFVNDRKYLERNGISPDLVASRLGKLYSEMIFVRGFIHCDPHPGNILVRKDGNLVLLDHGLYADLSDNFRMQYANMWLSIIQRDIKGIEDVARDMGVPDHLTRILASILTGRRWKAIESGDISKSSNSSETKEIKDYASKHVDLINAVLRSVPREMLLLLKTNDLLRGIESALGTRHKAKSFVTMSQCCVKAVYADRRQKAGGLVALCSLMVGEFFTQLTITISQWFRWFIVAASDHLHGS